MSIKCKLFGHQFIQTGGAIPLPEFAKLGFKFMKFGRCGKIGWERDLKRHKICKRIKSRSAK